MSGYDSSRFVGLDEIQRNEMLCSICLAILKNPIDTICGHTFCLNCITDWFRSYSNTCPECRQNLNPVFPSNVPFVESTKRFQNLINRLKIKCDFSEKGCEEVIDLGQLRSHLENCPFNDSKDKKQEIHWIPMRGSDPILVDAVEGGHESGVPLYVGRGVTHGDLIPGKINPLHRTCYISYGCGEFSVTDFELLTNPNKCDLQWIPSSNGRVPPNAVKGGKQSNGEVLYIGRVGHNDSLIVGKVHPSHQVLYIPYSRSELHYSYYEVLCLPSD